MILADIIADAIEPHSGGEDRFRIGGPHVQVAPEATLAFAMALHELATNAAKCGALSSDEGGVDISWRIDGNGDGRHLRFQWIERDGPRSSSRTTRASVHA